MGWVKHRHIRRTFMNKWMKLDPILCSVCSFVCSLPFFSLSVCVCQATVLACYDLAFVLNLQLDYRCISLNRINFEMTTANSSRLLHFCIVHSVRWHSSSAPFCKQRPVASFLSGGNEHKMESSHLSHPLSACLIWLINFIMHKAQSSKLLPENKQLKSCTNDAKKSEIKNEWIEFQTKGTVCDGLLFPSLSHTLNVKR